MDWSKVRDGRAKAYQVLPRLQDAPLIADGESRMPNWPGSWSLRDSSTRGFTVSVRWAGATGSCIRSPGQLSSCWRSTSPLASH